MNIIKLSIFNLTVLSIVACSRSGVIDQASITLCNPDSKGITLVAEDVSLQQPNVSNPLYLQLYKDTVLVVQKKINDDNQFHFEAYSTMSSAFLGRFVSNGRGPGEMLSPHIEPSPSNIGNLRLIENVTGYLYLVDVEKSISSNKTVFEDVISLPDGTLESVDLGGSMSFIAQVEEKELLYRVVTRDSKIIRTFHPFRRLDSWDSVTQLSSILLANERKGVVAEVMLFLPQVNFYDTSTGAIHSIAVDRNYRDWSSIIKEIPGPETTQYYQCATSSADYIFAIYDNVTLGHMINGDYHSSIHIFDWGGNFICQIDVEERLSDISYDSRLHCLFAIKKPSGKIVRYNVSHLINALNN